MENYETSSYLIHYGVPGMKWGVRREIAKKSKLGYYAGKYSYDYGRTADRLQRKQDKDKLKGKAVNAKRAKSIASYRKLQKKFAKAQSKLYSNMSDHDIKQGKRAAIATDIFKVVASGAVIGVGTALVGGNPSTAYATGAGIGAGIGSTDRIRREGEIDAAVKSGKKRRH